MNNILKRVLVIAITLVILIAVFWFLLPWFGVDEMFRGNYWMITLGGSLVLSYFLSGLLSKLIG